MILNVPYRSQLKDTKNPDWRDNACGIASLKMVFDFYRPNQKSIDELYQIGLDEGSFLEGVGWYHHGLVKIARSLGFHGITRNWGINEVTIQKLVERGFTDEDLNLLQKQLDKEGLFTLKEELNAGHPVIVSVPNQFEEGRGGHLPLLIGFENDQFFFNDPYDKEKSGEKVKISESEFMKVWSKRAIIIHN